MEWKNDPTIRDKKRMAFASLSEGFVPFLGTSLVMTPLWLTTLLPLSILSLGWKSLTSRSDSHGSAAGSWILNLPESAYKVQKHASDLSGREYDLVLFGATGFTGRLAAIYLAKTYFTSNKSSAGFTWALAGRRQDALEALRTELVQITGNQTLKELPIIIADSSKFTSIESMVQRCRIVLTTSGPFARYSRYLLHCCAIFGTHYCDITGETDFVREMIDLYDDIARESGAWIVNSCGNDCVPWDQLLLECAHHINNKPNSSSDDTIATFTCHNEMFFEPSGGTLETAITIFNERSKIKTKLGFDPMSKDPDTGRSSEYKIRANHPMWLGYNRKIKRWITPFVMSGPNVACFKRSNAVNKYSKKLTYREESAYPNFFSAFINFMGLVVFATSLTIPPLQAILRKFLLPAPGQGPSAETMDKGYLKLVAYAESISKNKKCKALMYFPTDTGYRDTARMLVESGLVLILQGDQVNRPGGVYTTASCQGRLLTQRLVNTGTVFEIQDL